MWKHYLQLPRPVHILCLGTFINRAGTFVIPFLTIYLQRELQLSTEFAASAMGAYGAGALAAAVVGGHLADRIGRRVVMLTSLLGGAGILLLFGFLTSRWAILGASATFALVTEMYRPAASAMIGDLVGPERRSHAFGLMYVAINLGFCIGPVVAGILTKHSFLWLFWGDALTAAIYAVIIILAIRETLPGRRPATTPSPEEGVGRQTDGDDFQGVALSAALKHILGDWPFLVFCLGCFCMANVFMQALTTFPLHLMERGIAPDIYGRIIAVNGLLIVGIQLPATSFISRFNRATMMICGAVLMAVGFGLTSVAATAWQFALTVVVWTCGEIMQAPLSPAIVTDLAPVHLRGRYMGVFTMCFSSAMMIGVPIGGAVLGRFGGNCLWGGSLVVALVAALLFWIVRRQIAQGPRTTE